MEHRGGRARERTARLCLLIVAAGCLALLVGVAAAATPTGLITPADQVTAAVTGNNTPEALPAVIVTVTQNETNQTTTAGSADFELPPPSTDPLIWGAFFAIIALLFSLPFVLQFMTNFCLRRSILKQLGYPPKCSEANRVELYKLLMLPVEERRGLARYSMMSGVILIVGAVLLILAFSDPRGDLLQTSLSVVMGALSSIIGFFFGGRASEDARERAKGKGGGTNSSASSSGGLAREPAATVGEVPPANKPEPGPAGGAGPDKKGLQEAPPGPEEVTKRVETEADRTIETGNTTGATTG